MRLRRILAAPILSGIALAQEPSGTMPLRLRLGQAATRAIANFHSADSVEESLRMQGSVLHPSLIALRLRIEASLNESGAALNKGEIESARESIGRAEGMIDKFAKK